MVGGDGRVIGLAGGDNLGTEGLLKRVFEIDMTACPKCGGPLTIIAAIVDPPVIAKILAHLGLPTRAPPRAPVKAYPLFQTA